MAQVVSAQVARSRPAPPPAQRFVTSDGVGLRVRQDGPESARLTVVLLHGWTCDHTVWDRVVDGLADAESVRVLRYDHRGHGGSAPAPRDTTTIDQLAEDAAGLIAERAPEGELLLVGHSMGGMTMMALAERYPELVRARVAGAVFVSTTPCSLARITLGLPGPLGGAVVRAENAATAVLGRTNREHFLARPAALRPMVRRLVFGAGAARRDVAALTAQLGRVHPASMSGFRRSFAVHERRRALAQFAGVPSTVLVGSRDLLTPVGHARIIARELPDARFVCYPKAGHMLPYERAAEVHDLIRAHIARIRHSRSAG
ncbi:pimeloyl-ACP methyl ester carboxylesterase [Tamaricihabitans halophyticus]|uniref:Pimeloyl-ACP methyl ester carboxylesterase n=1 Tax=Tamaricihabitans halophyticus TaxID=1262583 RepID=A0A4R2QIS5_9PSEU|nr:alpha/beta hydrolase [Tamaricihabitans halophyticus]TCP49270.1 pimeloyl-ACP methyl ester carboxylesterase [Tamaricihabitans halophyticus]